MRRAYEPDSVGHAVARLLVEVVGMIPAVYTHVAAALLAGALAFAGAWTAQGWRLGAQLASLKTGHAETLREIAGKTAKASEAVRKYEAGVSDQLADKDVQHYQELTHAQSETARMRACVAAGTCGVRIITRTTACAAGGDLPTDAGAGGVGDGAIELDPATAGRVLDLRESVQPDAAKLAYLRDYAQACWRAGVEGAGVVGGASYYQEVAQDSPDDLYKN